MSDEERNTPASDAGDDTLQSSKDSSGDTVKNGEENVVTAEAAVATDEPKAQYESPFTVVDALPPGYSKKPAGEPERKIISFTLDGADVRAPEGIMLVDAAKYGGVEIPVFCYEPKLGAPVGACRMCLVEIEGIPKLQTACSTPVRDGMAVITRSPRVVEAQNSVVEFLLANHPLDCPVCDKGGECPLQDISFGWGRGKSRFTEPKRHFEKPVALSPSIAIDRERCILCYRCVRFSQEISEDYQLVLLERGADSYVGTFDGNPYIAPFSGNVIELCPVGALTSRAYRFRARPWDIEQGGSVCTLCPSQCNVDYTVRDEKVMRTEARDNAGVDDGWLCDKGRFAYQAWESEARITTPMIRQGDKLLPARWEHALDIAAAALKKSGARTAALAGNGTTNEEAWLLRRLMREAFDSPHIDSRRSGKLSLDVARTLTDPAMTISVPDIEWSDAVLVLDSELVDDMPILDLRVRKAARRHGMKLSIATARPSTLDNTATAVARYAPGYAGAFVQALLAAISGEGDVDDLATRAGSTAESVRGVAESLSGAERPVILWSERMVMSPAGAAPAQALCNLAALLNLTQTDGAGLLQIPIQTNGRGLREVGFLPNFGPGLTDPDSDGKSSNEIAAALASDELSSVILMNVDPVLEYPNGAEWDAALHKANTVISFSAWMDPATERHATVVFPAEVGPEKEGTITHPDGRLQRLRQTVEHADQVNSGWWVINELAKRVGLDFGIKVVYQATAEIAANVPIYEGITSDEIGGTGVRWQERPAAAKLPRPARTTFDLAPPTAAPSPNGRLRFGAFRSLWSGAEVANAATLKPLAGIRRLELAPADGERLAVSTGDEVTVRTDGGEVKATVVLRDAVPTGSAFLLEDGGDASRAAVSGGPELVEVIK
ncbi:MAG TPA: NADH-quinone oxidoreductase subunit NuoG [Solirubrobacterales bacterium]|nr:NADH-quinone oxidoreductase subunit NuoG [Solirubrobacterales bacterium]